jgi:hypothetical protein
MAGNRASSCNMSLNSRWVAAQTALSPPQNGHQSPVKACRGQAGQMWSVNGFAIATLPVSAASAPPAAKGRPHTGHPGKRPGCSGPLTGGAARANRRYCLGTRLKPSAGALTTTEPISLSASV